jgi:hypothetical protein
MLPTFHKFGRITQKVLSKKSSGFTNLRPNFSRIFQKMTEKGPKQPNSHFSSQRLNFMATGPWLSEQDLATLLRKRVSLKQRKINFGLNRNKPKQP